MDIIRLIGIIECVLFLSVVSSLERPEHVHISLGEDASMVVVWSSRDLVNGILEYGVTSEKLDISVSGTVTGLPDEYYKANRYLYRSEIKNLSPGTKYYYRIVSISFDNPGFRRQTELLSFTVYNETNTKPDKYIIYGDMGADDSIPTYALLERLINTDEYTAILHVGDLGYDLHSDYGKRGDDFMRKIQPFASKVPYMTSPGNHEIGSDFKHYGTRFSMPGSPWPMPKDRLWYSYDIGLVHFISYSTEVFFSDNEDYACTQFDWLLQDLLKANQNREKRPWIIAMGHRPMYCSNNNGDDCTNRFLHRWVKYSLEDLFYAQGVDLIIQAHEHSYERLWPTYNNEAYGLNYTNPKAPVHIISGAAGSIEGVDWMSSNTGISNDWSAFRADTTSLFTIGILEIHNKSHLFFDQRDASDNYVLDSFWLVQNNHGPFVKNITCTGNGTDVHPSCSCPPPIRYYVYIVLGCVIAGVFIVLIVLAICCCYKCRRKYISVQVGYRKVADSSSKQLCHRQKHNKNIKMDFEEESQVCLKNDDEMLLI